MILRSISIFGILGLMAACSTEPTTHVEDLPGARNEAYRTAAQRYGIDQDWLVTLGYQQGRFEAAQQQDNADDPAIDMTDPSADLLADTPVDEADDATPAADDPMETAIDQSWGLMYLTDAQVERAAQLTGRDSDTLKSDFAANIDGAAAILAEDSHAMGSLRTATTSFLGVEDDAATLALTSLDNAMAAGFDITTQDGERLVLDGDGAQLQPDIVSPDDETDAPPVGIEAKVKPGTTPPFQWIRSPNFGSRDGYAIRYVVIHDMEGTMPGAISVFKNPRIRPPRTTSFGRATATSSRWSTSTTTRGMRVTAGSTATRSVSSTRASRTRRTAAAITPTRCTTRRQR
jgi:hypothetical protein